MSCPPVNTLSNSTFSAVCIVSNATANTALQGALKTCCGSSNVHTSGCYTYCNITTAFDEIMWSNCLLDSLTPEAKDTFDHGCNPSTFGAGEDSVAESLLGNAKGTIATTWTFPYYVSTYTTAITKNFYGQIVEGTASNSGSATGNSNSTFATITSVSNSSSTINSSGNATSTAVSSTVTGSSASSIVSSSPKITSAVATSAKTASASSTSATPTHNSAAKFNTRQPLSSSAAFLLGLLFMCILV